MGGRVSVEPPTLYRCIPQLANRSDEVAWANGCLDMEYFDDCLCYISFKFGAHFIRLYSSLLNFVLFCIHILGR